MCDWRFQVAWRGLAHAFITMSNRCTNWYMASSRHALIFAEFDPAHVPDHHHIRKNAQER